MARSTVEREWIAHGLDCAVLRLDMGHRCGYVCVPESHPWHRIGYSEPAPGAPPSGEAMNENAINEDMGILSAFCYAISDEDKRAEYASTPEFRIAVHGSLTFSGDLPGVSVSDGWWFGFDCAHADDSPAVWTEDAVAAETERLAEQLAVVGQATHV